MIAMLWRSLAFVAVFATGLAAANETAAQTAYAWADQPTVNGYKPNPLYAFNPNGDVTIMRRGTGSYTVVFENFGAEQTGNPGGGGQVQVSPYGSADRCGVRSWNYLRPNFTVNVACFKGGTANTPIDARFTVMATFEAVRMVTLPMMSGMPDFEALQADISAMQDQITEHGERIRTLER